MRLTDMLEQAEEYYWVMASRGRLIRIDEGRTGLCTFFILDHPGQLQAFHRRPCWETPPDVPTGKLIYIDKLLSQSFTRQLFRQIEQVITARYPLWEMAAWYRPGQSGDRLHRYDRRKPHGADLHRQISG